MAAIHMSLLCLPNVWQLLKSNISSSESSYKQWPAYKSFFVRGGMNLIDNDQWQTMGNYRQWWIVNDRKRIMAENGQWQTMTNERQGVISYNGWWQTSVIFSYTILI